MPLSTEVDDEMARLLTEVDKPTLSETVARHALTIMRLRDGIKRAGVSLDQGMSRQAVSEQLLSLLK